MTKRTSTQAGDQSPFSAEDKVLRVIENALAIPQYAYGDNEAARYMRDALELAAAFVRSESAPVVREKVLTEALRIALSGLSRIALTVTSGHRLREYAQDALSAVNEIDPAALKNAAPQADRKDVSGTAERQPEAQSLPCGVGVPQGETMSNGDKDQRPTPSPYNPDPDAPKEYPNE